MAVPIASIVLSPLGLEHTQRLLADALHTDETRVLPLAHLLLEKTGGNPFFLTQFLGTLHREKLLQFDTAAREWRWELARIQAQGFTDNVVDLMVAKLRELPAPTQDALEVAACIGNTFDAEDVRELVRSSLEELEARLFGAIQERLILRSEHGYRFLHDRIQQAAYLLTPEDQRIALHLRIGRMLRAPAVGGVRARQPPQPRGGADRRQRRDARAGAAQPGGGQERDPVGGPCGRVELPRHWL
ncbi:ATP-binding protein [Cystobacter fuscus]